ncbi:glycosyltransferase [Shewanella chilikensis]|uniref:glycosyltransferase n=1 Tax=Shewanella chilikensis TaxID=558541 RepID=UPI001F19423A|nr:glycosyltransferase [Shewanella chilikensis]MCE9789078.1 glycosyltransferase [Shewanella chilikensis]
MVEPKSVALVLTSCNRFDLLEATLRSFFKFNTYPIAQYIIIEDSHNLDKLLAVLGKFPDVDFTVLNNEPQLGQMKSIDRAYSKVTSEYIFHCEDDWEFYREGFIEDSLKVLDSDEHIMTVWLREQDDTNNHPIESKVFNCQDISGRDYQIMQRNYKRKSSSDVWHGFTFNPGLRRFKDYQLVAPIGELNGEMEMSKLYHSKGFKAAIFETGYVRHIGYHRGIRYKVGDSRFAKDLSVGFKRMKAKICQLLGI